MGSTPRGDGPGPNGRHDFTVPGEFGSVTKQQLERVIGGKNFKPSPAAATIGSSDSMGYRSRDPNRARDGRKRLPGRTSNRRGRAAPSKYPSHPSKFLILLPSPPELSILCKTISK